MKRLRLVILLLLLFGSTVALAQFLGSAPVGILMCLALSVCPGGLM
jgi:hypothetical protein